MFRTSLSFRWMLPFVWAATPALTPVAHAAGVPSLDHIIVVVMENKNYDQVRTAPYIARLVASGSSFSNYHAITHPSQPNYIALWSGSTQGVADDACPAPGSPFTGENLGHACEAAGLTWRAYAEDLPAVGSSDCRADGGQYARKHDPWTDFANVNHQNERPYADLAADIAGGRLPALTFVIPNMCNDMHSCPVEKGDAWLSNNLPAMLRAVGPRGIVVLTWDEADDGPTNQILTVINGTPLKHGYVSSRAVTHYTLLRTICDALNLPVFGAARSEAPITDIWTGAESAPVASAQRQPSSGARAQLQPTGPVAVRIAPDESSGQGTLVEGRGDIGAERQPPATVGRPETSEKGTPSEHERRDNGQRADQSMAVAPGEGGESGDEVEPAEYHHRHHHHHHHHHHDDDRD